MTPIFRQPRKEVRLLDPAPTESMRYEARESKFWALHRPVAVREYSTMGGYALP
jgi:hypothetical protein